LGKFHAGGLVGLLERKHPPGLTSFVATPEIQVALASGIESGCWKSAAEIARWLKREYQVELARKSVYYWLKKNGWRAPGAR